MVAAVDAIVAAPVPDLSVLGLERVSFVIEALRRTRRFRLGEAFWKRLTRLLASLQWSTLRKLGVECACVYFGRSEFRARRFPCG